MLRFLKTYETKDFVRDLQLNFNYGIQICPNNRSVQWHGAYADSEGTVSAFTARKVASSGEVEKSYVLDTACILYANGQYYYDPDSFYGDGILPEGFYYLEFSDENDTYYSELFCVKELVNQFLSSGDWLASGSFLVSQITIEPVESVEIPDIDSINLELTEYSVALNSGAQNYTNEVASNMAWNIDLSTVPAWITVNVGSGNDGYSIDIDLSENTGAERTANLKIIITLYDSVYKTLTILQDTP